MPKKKRELLEIFKNFLKDQNLENKKIIISVSGGVDSMVLLDVALKTIDKKNLAVFHVNHNTREANETEARYLEKLCTQEGIRFYGYNITQKIQKNKENDWRIARKIFGTETKKKFATNILLTAHHATDLVETMIFRLTKGSGPCGLSPFDTTSKPFWHIPKHCIIEYAQEKKLTWFEDITNTDIHYHRNLIRHQVLPVLRTITPNLEQVFVKEAKIFEQVNSYLEIESKKIITTANNQIPLVQFLQYEPSIQQFLLRSISDRIPSSSEITDCLRWLNNNPKGGSRKKIGNKEIFIKKNKIIF